MTTAGTLLVHRLAWLAAVLVLAATREAASAPADAPIIVLKARVGTHDPKAVDDLTPLIDHHLEAEGFVTRPEAIRSLIGGHMPLPGIVDSGISAADVIRPIELGYEDWRHGLFAEAEKKLAPAYAALKRNPALFVADTKNLDVAFKGLVALALSQSRQGRTRQCEETMIELVRVFRSRPISRIQYGKPAEQLWQTFSKQAVAKGTGQLFVTTGNDKAVIFVDGHIRGIGKAEIADLVPGKHRVFVQVPSTPGLQYEVDVRPDDETRLDMKWDVDISLAVTDQWIGFVFESEAERNKEAAFASELARRWGRAGMMAVVGTYQIQGTPVLIGAVYRANGAIYRGAITALHGDRRGDISDLAKYLAHGTVSPKLQVMSRQGGQQPAATLTARQSKPGTTLVAKIATGAGAATVAVGAVVYWQKPYEFAVPPHPDWRTGAVYTMLGGSAVIGGGTYLWLRESRSASHLTAGMIGAGAASLIAGTALYVTDEDPSRELPPRIRDSAPIGVVTASLGVALTGVGLWLLRREGAAAREVADVRGRGELVACAPSVAVDRSQFFIGCTAGF
jgi:hypothetical protein